MTQLHITAIQEIHERGSAQHHEPSTWLYIQSEANLWTVGFYRPDGVWEPESDHASPEKAAERVHWLNGRCGCDCSTDAGEFR